MKYQALMAGSVDIIDAYSTDGLLGRYPITVLEDDRHFFPPTTRPRSCAGRPRARCPRPSRP
ncbi:MAG: glycine betaine ABC transporter substrate-binding protein [Vicinamibacterales bacterium]